MCVYPLQARPPGIYKEHYLKELAERYNGGSMVDIIVPERPGWCLEDEDEDTTPEVGEGEGGGGGGKKGKKRGREFQNEV